jgi:hypothetical protein
MLITQVKPPTAKTNIKARRWRVGSLSCFSTGRGRMAMARSVAMLRPAFENLDGF